MEARSLSPLDRLYRLALVAAEGQLNHLALAEVAEEVLKKMASEVEEVLMKLASEEAGLCEAHCEPEVGEVVELENENL